jgi:hypothetical protein
MKKRAFAAIVLSASMLSHAELPSGTVASLLQKAESGDLFAMYSLTGGLRQLSVDSDDPMNAHINGKTIPAILVAQLTPATSAYTIAMMYNRPLPEMEAMAFFCRWAQRSFLLRRTDPVGDAETQMKWQVAQDTFEDIVEPLTQEQRSACDAQSKNWGLKRP